MNKYRTYARLVLITALLSSLVAHSEDVSFQGYFSQGLIYSGYNPFFDDDTGLNFNYRELGLNLSWSASERLRFAGQILSRKAGLLEDGDPRLDFLLVDYTYYTSENFSAGIRLGRVKNQYGLYNTTRDVPHARPGVFVPQSVYFESMRSALLSSDGGDLYFSLSTDLVDMTVDAYGGKAHFDNEAMEYQLFQVDMPGEFDDVDGAGIKLSVEPKAIRDLTAAVTWLDISTEYQDAPTFTPAEQFAAGTVLASNPSLFPYYITNLEMDATMRLYSLQYATGDWILTGEYLTIDIEFDNTEILHQPQPASAFRDSFEVNAYYLQAEWLASANLSVYTRYEELYNDKSDKDGKEYAKTNGGNPVTQYDKAFTVGARWYFTPDVSVTAEYSVNKGAAFINGQPEIDYSTLKEDWDVFIMQFSYHF